jgi:hypothetical protein
LVAIAALAITFGVSWALDDYRWSKDGVYASGVVAGHEYSGFLGEIAVIEAGSLDGVRVLMPGSVGPAGTQVAFTYLPDEVSFGSVWAEPGDSRHRLWLTSLVGGFVVAGGAIWLAVGAFLDARRQSKQDPLLDPRRGSPG